MKLDGHEKLKIKIQGDGSEVRSFAHVDDIVDGIKIIMARGKSGELYHLGNPEPITILELVKKIAAKLKVDIDLGFSPRLSDSPLVRIPDIQKARSIGYEPKITLNEGLQRMIDHMISELD